MQRKRSSRVSRMSSGLRRPRRRVLFLIGFVLLLLFVVGALRVHRPPLATPLEGLCYPPPSSPFTVADSSKRFDSVPTKDGSHTVRVRFITVTTNPSEQLFNYLASARLAGVPVEVIGLGWKGFALPRRYKMIGKYITSEGLHDDDVVMLLDSDTLFTGEDLYRVMKEFIASSPASAAETDPRLVRMNQQTPPVLFSSEPSCYSPEVEKPEAHHCIARYALVDNLLSDWATSLGMKYELNGPSRIRNPNEYLNSGALIGRVWALRLVEAAFFDYMKTVPAVTGSPYAHDQGVFAALLWKLITWEVEKGVLDAPDRFGKVGPHGMVGGMIGLDYHSKFAISVVPVAVPLGANVEYDGHPFAKGMDVESARSQILRHIQSSAEVRSVTAAGAPMATLALTNSLPSTPSSNPDHLGIPLVDMTRPAIWHFNGRGKQTFGFLPFFLPTTIILEASPAEVNRSREVFHGAPKTKVWVVQPSSTAEDDYSLIRQPASDFAAADLCQLVGR